LTRAELLQLLANNAAKDSTYEIARGLRFKIYFGTAVAVAMTLHLERQASLLAYAIDSTSHAQMV